MATIYKNVWHREWNLPLFFLQFKSFLLGKILENLRNLVEGHQNDLFNGFRQWKSENFIFHFFIIGCLYGVASLTWICYGVMICLRMVDPCLEFCFFLDILISLLFCHCWSPAFSYFVQYYLKLNETKIIYCVVNHVETLFKERYIASTTILIICMGDESWWFMLQKFTVLLLHMLYGRY